MSTFKRKRNLIIAGLAVIGLIGAGSIAYAAFTTVSTATAASSAGTLQPLGQLGQSITYPNGESTLWPNVNDNGDNVSDPTAGRHLGTINVKVRNSNQVPVKIATGSVTGTVAFDDASHFPGGVSQFPNAAAEAACDGWIHLTSLAVVGGPVIVDKGSDAIISLQYVYLDGWASNDCIGKSFTASLSITGQAV